jgi:hypothetical protein
MREWLNIAIGIVLLSAVFTYEAVASSPSEYKKMAANNHAIKECLLAHGYNGNVLTNGKQFDWAKASACYHDYKQGVMSEEYVKLKFFLEEHPWYKGRNWDWEKPAMAGYECIKYHHTGTKICKKPYFKK